LSKLKAPAGFAVDVRCGEDAGRDAICFRRPRSVVLNEQATAEMTRETGADVERATTSCSPTVRFARPRLRLVACSARATLAGEHLALTVRSLVIATQTTEVPTTRSAAGVPGGSEIIVTDVGH
jgi:hypothetical protein